MSEAGNAKFASAPVKISLELLDEELIKKEETVWADKILSLSKKEKLPIMIGLPDEFVFSKQIALSGLKKEISNVIAEDLEKIFPVKKEDVYADFEILEEKPEASRVQVVAVWRSVIDLLSGLISKTKLPLVGFEPVAFSLARLTKNISDSHFILFYEKELAISLIAKSGEVLFSSSKYFNQDVKTEASLNDAVGQELETYIFGEIIPKFNEFLKNKGEKEIKKIYIYGEDRTEIKKWFEEKFKKNFEIFTFLDKKESPFADLLGLSQKGLPEIENYGEIIDLLPPNQLDFLINKDKRKRKIILNTILRVFFLISILSFSFANYYLFSLYNQHKNALRGAESETILEKRQSLIQNVQNLNQVVSLAESLLSKRIPLASFKDEFLAYVPSGVNLSFLKLDFERGDGEAAGFAKTRADFSQFIDKLEKSVFIEKVDFPLSLFDKKADFDFDIILKIKKDKFFIF